MIDILSWTVSDDRAVLQIWKVGSFAAYIFAFVSFKSHTTSRTIVQTFMYVHVAIQAKNIPTCGALQAHYLRGRHIEVPHTSITSVQPTLLFGRHLDVLGHREEVVVGTGQMRGRNEG
jgi:hypothetical protein